MKTERQHKQVLAAKEAAHAVFAERLQLENNKLRVELHQVKEENEKLHASHEALEKLLAASNEKLRRAHEENDELREMLVASKNGYNAEQRAHNATRLSACRVARALFEATAAIDNLGKQLLDDVAEPAPDSESAADA